MPESEIPIQKKRIERTNEKHTRNQFNIRSLSPEKGRKEGRKRRKEG